MGSSALVLCGALVVVAARSSPIVNAAGLVVSMTGVAGACGLAGAPLFGLLQLIISLAVALTFVLFSLTWVGTGRDPIAPLSPGRVVARVFAGLAAVAWIGIIASVGLIGLPDGPPGAVPDAGGRTLGRSLFQDDVIVVGVLGLILLVAILGGVVLAARRSD